MNEMQKDITELKTLQREQMELQRGIIRRLDGQQCNQVDVQPQYSDNVHVDNANSMKTPNQNKAS